MARRLLILLLLAAFAGAHGCAAIVGDDCDNDGDCGSGLVCERSLPGGYCTVRDCVINGCPDEGICIVFDAQTSFCMAPCNGGSDCRDTYVCEQDFGAHPFCSAVEAP